MAAEAAEHVQRLLQPIQPAETVAIPMFILSAAPLGVPAGHWQGRCAHIINEILLSSLFHLWKTALRSALLSILRDDTARHSRGIADHRSPVLSLTERPCTARERSFLRIRLSIERDCFTPHPAPARVWIAVVALGICAFRSSASGQRRWSMLSALALGFSPDGIRHGPRRHHYGWVGATGNSAFRLCRHCISRKALLVGADADLAFPASPQPGLIRCSPDELARMIGATAHGLPGP